MKPKSVLWAPTVPYTNVGMSLLTLIGPLLGFGVPYFNTFLGPVT